MAGRVSIFVDAGYLFKQGAGAVLGAKLGRREVQLDARRFVSDLAEWLCIAHPEEELLRTYWYDGAAKGVPTSEQLDVAALPFVKVRLGRINSAGQQKGVDTLMVRDLMVLSQERSIQRAVVLSGDEDLREGIEYAQDRGVRVAVVGIDAQGDLSQSPELVREADEALVLPEGLLSSSLTRVSRPRTVAIAETAHRSPSTTPSLGTPGSLASNPFATHAAAFTREWLAKAPAGAMANLVAGRPAIPRDIDAQMLRFAVERSGVRTIGDDDRRAMRAIFWLVLTNEAPPAT
ncbi:MAG: NYN domain-containing protein [Mycobacteriales bacterium]